MAPAVSPTLERLALVADASCTDARIDADDRLVLRNALARLNTLEVKNIALAPSTAAAIFAGVSNNKSLKSLTLHTCGLDAGSAEDFAKMLSGSSVLHSLDIGGNAALDDASLRIIFGALKTNHRLRSLNIVDVPLSDATVRTLVTTLEIPTSAPLTNVRHGPIRDGLLAGRIARVTDRNGVQDSMSSSVSSFDAPVAPVPAYSPRDDEDELNSRDGLDSPRRGEPNNDDSLPASPTGAEGRSHQSDGPEADRDGEEERRADGSSPARYNGDDSFELQI